MIVEQNNNDNTDFNIWPLYLFAKSTITREKYQKRLEKFFDFIGLEGRDIEEKSMQAQINYDGISITEEHLSYSKT